jgi:hypothetical protein
MKVSRALVTLKITGAGDTAKARSVGRIRRWDSGLVLLKTEPYLDRLRKEPRFRAIKGAVSGNIAVRSCAFCRLSRRCRDNRQTARGR